MRLKSLSWSKLSSFSRSRIFFDIFESFNFGISGNSRELKKSFTLRINFIDFSDGEACRATLHYNTILGHLDASNQGPAW